jgi:hypothetical protein
MAVFDIRWESEEEKTVVEALMMDWALYGQIHMTNAHGLTRLDPRGISYASPLKDRFHEPGCSRPYHDGACFLGQDPNAECGFVYTHGSGYQERCTRPNKAHPYPGHGGWKRASEQ